MPERRSGPVPTAAPSAWANVRLIEGDSPADQWQIDSGTPQAQISVGTDSACDWRVSAAGVAPLHLHLCWDGRRLWIAGTEAAGVRIDGEQLGAWKPISGRSCTVTP